MWSFKAETYGIVIHSIHLHQFVVPYKNPWNHRRQVGLLDEVLVPGTDHLPTFSPVLVVGDLFVGRVAGNVENGDQLGSMEFAAKLSGVKLVMVLGHSQCGAVKGACDGAQLGNLTGLLAKIQPAVAAVDGYAASERNSKNAAFVADVVQQNVRQTVNDIRSQSAVLAQLEREGAIRIVGAHYSLESGEVTLVN